ncbi:MAG: hypothetical protein QM800_13985 [Paludibacter sp.]
MKSIIKFLLSSCFLIVVSCGQPTDMLTVINSDGSCYREFAVNADSAFLRGNVAGDNNPFPMDIDSTWEIRWSYLNAPLRTDFPLSKSLFDSIHKLNEQGTKEDIMVYARKHYKTVEELDRLFKFKKSMEWSNLKAKHELGKEFRWFYTYYTYKETYSQIKTGFELPVEDFMTKDEAMFWFTGKPDILKGMNGVEARIYIEEIEADYNRWLLHNCWNSEYKALITNYDQMARKPVSKKQLIALRDSIFETKVKSEKDYDVERVLNDFFQTDAFSELWLTDNSPMKKFEKDFNYGFSDFFSQSFNYKLILPGKIVQSSDAKVHGDTLIWNLTAYRMIPADYTIEAQSRKTNVWAFVLSGIILIAAVGSFFWKRKR